MTTSTHKQADDDATPEVTLVTSHGCHFCADAEDALTEISRETPLHITRLAATSPLGLDLMQSHGAGMSPLVLLDGQFVSSGRLSRGRLRTLLGARSRASLLSTP